VRRPLKLPGGGRDGRRVHHRVFLRPGRQGGHPALWRVVGLARRRLFQATNPGRTHWFEVPQAILDRGIEAAFGAQYMNPASWRERS
jgi:hypothetical protein